MIKTKCQICGLVLEGGAEEVTVEDLNFVMAGIDKLNEVFRRSVGEEARKKQERAEYLKSIGAREQVCYHAHDPRDLHRDILVTAHKDCFYKVKAIYPVFDQPVQDYDICRYKVIEKEKVVEKTPKEFILMNNLAYIQTLTELISKTKEEMKVAKDFELPEKQKTITQLEVKIAEIKLENKNLIK